MEPDLHFSQLVAVLRRRLRLIIAIGLSGTVLVCLIAWELPVRYTAKAQLVIDGDRPTVMAGQIVSNDMGADEATILTEVTALTSYDLLQRVRQGLREDARFQAIRARHRPGVAADAGTEVPSWLSLAWEWVTETAWRAIVQQYERRTPAVSEAADSASDAALAPSQDEIRRHLKVFQELGSHVIAVSYSATDPEEAAIVANRIATTYLKAQEEQRRVTSDRTLAGLAQSIPEQKAEMRKLETAVVSYQNAHGLMDATRSNVMDQKLGELSKQLSEAQSELAGRKTRLARLVELKQDTADWAPLLAGLSVQGLVDLHSQLVSLLQSRADAIAPTPTSVQNGQPERLASRPLRQKLQNELDQAVAKLGNDEAVAAARVDAIQQRVQAVQGASDDVTLRDLIATAASARHRYERLLIRRDETLEQQDAVSTTARLLSLAPVPDRPSSLNPIFLVPPAIIAFFVMGSFLAILKDRLDQTLRSESDVAAALAIRCIGFVPRLRRLGRTRPHQHLLGKPYAPYAEAIRSIMASLQPVELHGRLPKVILVSSSLPGEGKTTLAVSLAAYAAGCGRRVLLLDLDFRHSAVSRELGGTAERGVLDLLSGKQPDAQAIQHVAGLQLDYLPVRHGLLADALPLLAGDQVSLLLQRLRLSYDYVFIDSAPILAVAETRLLATRVDKILFVVQWGKTRRNEAQNALGLLRAAVPDGTLANLVHAVVTQVDLKRHAREGYGDRGEALARYSQHYVPG